jgi:hypothetical protein
VRLVAEEVVEEESVIEHLLAIARAGLSAADNFLAMKAEVIGHLLAVTAGHPKHHCCHWRALDSRLQLLLCAAVNPA